MGTLIVNALKILAKSKVGKAVIVAILASALCIIAIYFSFWNQFLCTITFGLFNNDCKEKREVLVYDPVTEEDVIELGKQIYELRLLASTEIVDKGARDWLDSHGHPEKDNVDYPGEVYRYLKIGEGFADNCSDSSVSGNSYTEKVVNIIMENEGTYDSINKKSHSLGKMQWLDDRARDLLKSIREADKETFDGILSKHGTTLRSFSSSWDKHRHNSTQLEAIKEILKTDASKKVQDELALKEIGTDYRKEAEGKGITEPSAVAFWSDLYHHKPSEAYAVAKAAKDKTIDSLYEAANKNVFFSGRPERNKKAYDKAKTITSFGDGEENEEDKGDEDTASILGCSGSSSGTHVYSADMTNEKYFSWAQDAAAQTGLHPLFIMTQWVQETGWFESSNFRNNNNLAGQTWYPGCNCKKGTPRPQGEGGYYIKYDDAVDGYVSFIKSNKRYDDLPSYKTAKEQLAAVAGKGWATDPLYLQKLYAVLDGVEKRFGSKVKTSSVSLSSSEPVVGLSNSEKSSQFSFTKNADGLGRKYNTKTGAHPYIEGFANEFIKQAKKELNLDLVVTQGYRSSADQQKYLEGGTSQVGPGSSWHNWGMAVDIVPSVNGQPTWDDLDLNKNGKNDFDEIIAFGSKLGNKDGFYNLYAKVGFDKPHWENEMGMTREELKAGKTPPDKTYDGSGESYKGITIAEKAEEYFEKIGKKQKDKNKKVGFKAGGTELKEGGKADAPFFVQKVYQDVGIVVEGSISGQFNSGEGDLISDINSLNAGDIIFFKSAKEDGVGDEVEIDGEKVKLSFVGIYIDNGQFIHLSSAEDTIIKSELKGEFKEAFIGAKRMVDESESSFEMETAGEVNEAEMHLRALMNADLHALNALELNEETLEQKPLSKEGVPYNENTKIYKAWLIAQTMKEWGKNGKGDRDYRALYKRSIEAKQEEGLGQNWIAFNWLLYTQHEAYKCYMVGDKEMSLLEKLLDNVFGLGKAPCTNLDKLYREATGDKDAIYIKEEDRAVVQHQHATIERRCVKVEKKTSFIKDIKEFFEVESVYAAHDSKITGPDKCGADEVLVEDVSTFLTYGTLREILYDFEPYAMFEVGVTVDKKDGTYKELIDFILWQIYDELDGGEVQDYIFTPSGDWLVPMEKKSYNHVLETQKFRNSVRPGHEGNDLATQGVQRVPVYATASGVVTSVAKNTGGYGGVIAIDHKNGYATTYNHFRMEDIVVKKGQTVQQGQLLGGAGDQPNVDWHLHFEICKGGVLPASNGSEMCATRVDPTSLVKDIPEPNHDVSLSKKRSGEFSSIWKSKALAGEVILMPNFTPKEDGGSEGDGEKEKEGEGEKVKVKSFELNLPLAGLYEKDKVKGNVLGIYGLEEKKDEFGTVGSLYKFGDYLKDKYPDFYKELRPYDPSSEGFVNRWKNLSYSRPNDFLKAQEDFVKKEQD